VHSSRKATDHVRSFSAVELFQAYCGMARVWGLYISFVNPPEVSFEDAPGELAKAVPYFDELTTQAWCNGQAFLVFDSEQEMRKYYNNTVGEDGPTASNPYDGPARAYALAIGTDGKALTENT
jgi:hypothetical protein